MKVPSAILAILVAVFMAGPAIAAEHLQEDEEEQDDQAETSFTLLTNMDEEGSFFTQEGDTDEERNPDLVVPADEEITVTLRNDDGVQHNFCVELEAGEECSDDVAEEGDEAELNFTAPSEGTMEYWCDYHPQEMAGQVRVAEDEADDEGEEDGIDDPQDPFDPQDPGETGDEPETEDDQDTPGFAVVAVLAAFALVAFVALRHRR